MRLPIPIVMDPRLIVRALEDLHAIAGAARRVDEVVSAVDALASLDARAGAAVAAVDRLDARADAAVAAVDRLDARADAAIAAVDRIDARAAGVLDGIDRVDARAQSVLDGVDRVLVALARVDNVETQVAELVRLAAELQAGLPTLDEALESIRSLNVAAGTLAAAAEPLQGTAERLGRIADRLPGLRPRSG